jgi:hypothetical protein
MSTDPVPSEIPDHLRPLANVGAALEGVYRKLVGLRRYLSEAPQEELVRSISLTYRLAVQMAVPEVAAAAPWMDDPARPPGERWTVQVAGELLELSRFFMLLEKGDLPIGELARDYTTDTPWGWNYLHLAQHLAKRIDEVVGTLAVVAAPAATPVTVSQQEAAVLKGLLSGHPARMTALQLADLLPLDEKTIRTYLKSLLALRLVTPADKTGSGLTAAGLRLARELPEGAGAAFFRKAR